MSQVGGQSLGLKVFPTVCVLAVRNYLKKRRCLILAQMAIYLKEEK